MFETIEEDMDLCTCEVQLGGDMRNTVPRGVMNPVSYPEIYLLREAHGIQAVTKIEYMTTVKRGRTDEMQRLQGKFLPKVIAAVYPGASGPAQLPMVMNDASKKGKTASAVAYEEHLAALKERDATAAELDIEEATKAAMQAAIDATKATKQVEVAKAKIAS